MKALDLFCGAGGASMGLFQAGFEVMGVDIHPQPHYPFRFIQSDALEWKEMAEFLDVDLIWASPPCQRFSVMTKRWKGRKEKHPDLIGPTRKMLQEAGKPYIIENVVGAPLIHPILLCGSMFDLQTKHGSQLRRHRLFECSFFVWQPECRHNAGSVIGVYGGGQHPGRRYHKNPDGTLRTPHKKYPSTIGVYGNTGGSSSKRDGLSFFGVADRRDAMGIQWMSGKELNQAIPPAYAKYLAEQFLQSLQTNRRGAKS